MRTWPALVVVLCAGVLLAPRPGRASELRRTAVVRAVEAAAPAVVDIRGEKTVPDELAADTVRRVNGMGTGVLIDPRGYIATNYHVVEGVQRIQVTLFDRTSYVARLVAREPASDLAIIKIDAGEKLPVIKLGTSRDLMLGEPTIVVGNPFGYDHTVTRGIISALHRTVQVNESLTYEDLIQTDASINPGNSGGPLLNIDGEMIGMAVAVRAGAQGIGFAIPVDRVVQACTEMLARRPDGIWHGMVAQPSEEAGYLVQRVERDSPAARLGVRSGDLIVAVDGQLVERPLSLELALLERRAGETVELTIRRGGQLSVQALALAAQPLAVLAGNDAAWNLLGLRLVPVPADQFRRLRTRYRGGLQIADVRPGSPADVQGLRRGDILLGLHIWETISLDNVAYVLSRPDLREQADMRFYILRGTETLYGFLPLHAAPPGGSSSIPVGTQRTVR
jgi:serine protease Do